MGTGSCVIAQVWSLEDNFQESVVSFCSVGSGDTLAASCLRGSYCTLLRGVWRRNKTAGVKCWAQDEVTTFMQLSFLCAGSLGSLPSSVCVSAFPSAKPKEMRLNGRLCACACVRACERYHVNLRLSFPSGRETRMI